MIESFITWLNDNHLKLNTIKTLIRHTQVQPGSIDDLINHHILKVGTQE